MRDTWIYAKPAAWEAINPGVDQPWPHENLSRYNYNTAITGMWDSYPGGYEVYNVLITPQDLEALKVLLGANMAHSFCWIQGTGMDSLDEGGQTIPAEVLAVMPDHITYDEDGNPTDTTPATYDNPNWRHVFVDQKQRIFAGQFSNQFSRQFR